MISARRTDKSVCSWGDAVIRLLANCINMDEVCRKFYTTLLATRNDVPKSRGRCSP